MVNVMADHVDDDVCSYTGKPNSSSSLKPIDSQRIDSQQINNAISITSEKDDLACLLAPNSAKTSQRNDGQSKKEKRQLIIATTLCFFFMFAEIMGGYMAGSLAIMSDAAHLLSDCISFIVALLAIIWAKKSPDNYMTFGYRRIEVLGAILSIFGIWLLTTFLFYFAVNRLMYQDFDIDADTMMIVSAVGIVINVIMALILHGEGLCCFSKLQQHHRHNCHSHKHDQAYHNNNKTKFEYRPLINEATDKRAKPWTSPKRTERQDLSRSPSRSDARLYFANDHSDMVRRGSHSAQPSSNKIKDIIDLQANDCVDIDLTDDKLPINTDEMRGCVTNGSAICPTHHYVHRDSSEHTPITSSDSEELHDHRHHHHHSLVSNSHHSHNFSSKNINIQAAVIHVIGDFIQSIGVFIAAIIIKNYPNAKIADPLCTFIFSIIVMMTTCTIMKDSIGIILEAVPNSINTGRLKQDLQSIDGVRSIHNLNIWSLTVGWHVMSVHIIIDTFVESADVLYIATTIAQKGYNIKQCTIQIEKHRDPDGEETTNIQANQKPHSIVAENDNSIINILT